MHDQNFVNQTNITLFIVVHLMALAVIGMAATLVGDGLPDQNQHDGSHMRLVEIHSDGP